MKRPAAMKRRECAYEAAAEPPMKRPAAMKRRECAYEAAAEPP